MSQTPKVQWWPEHMLDEMMPVGLPTPQQYVKANDGGLEDTVAGFIYEPGERVAFLRSEFPGHVTVSMAPGGKLITPFRCDQTPDLFTGEAGSTPEITTPPNANWFWSVDENQFCDTTVEGFIQQYASSCFTHADEEPHDVTIGMAVQDTYEFTVSADGKSLAAPSGSNLPPSEVSHVPS